MNCNDTIISLSSRLRWLRGVNSFQPHEEGGGRRKEEKEEEEEEEEKERNGFRYFKTFIIFVFDGV